MRSATVDNTHNVTDSASVIKKTAGWMPDSFALAMKAGFEPLQKYANTNTDSKNT